ncbi:unnamed protein product [Protopolystoma xenopodis]|uniref:Uncharacterized protein n=1 Tax=Protopolystoma xenopodis TaxID=117903 RepID=A0A448XI76_9PLAT|nr:unnamed protein product [Protopolystoma xenopodis]
MQWGQLANRLPVQVTKASSTFQPSERVTGSLKTSSAHVLPSAMPNILANAGRTQASDDEGFTTREEQRTSAAKAVKLGAGVRYLPPHDNLLFVCWLILPSNYSRLLIWSSYSTDAALSDFGFSPAYTLCESTLLTPSYRSPDCGTKIHNMRPVSGASNTTVREQSAYLYNCLSWTGDLPKEVECCSPDDISGAQSDGDLFNSGVETDAVSGAFEAQNQIFTTLCWEESGASFLFYEGYVHERIKSRLVSSDSQQFLLQQHRPSCQQSW